MGAIDIDLDRLLGTDEAMIVSSVRLECINKQKNQFKFYEVRIEQCFDDVNSPYRCVGYYGRIGAKTIKMDTKYEGTSKYSAENMMAVVLREKRKKGYK